MRDFQCLLRSGFSKHVLWLHWWQTWLQNGPKWLFHSTMAYFMSCSEEMAFWDFFFFLWLHWWQTCLPNVIMLRSETDLGVPTPPIIRWDTVWWSASWLRISRFFWLSGKRRWSNLVGEAGGARPLESGVWRREGWMLKITSAFSARARVSPLTLAFTLKAVRWKMSADLSRAVHPPGPQRGDEEGAQKMKRKGRRMGGWGLGNWRKCTRFFSLTILITAGKKNK